jgi:ketosteroid isomerase-like protein
MPSRNVDVAREFTDAFNAGDIDSLVACCDPEIEFHSTFAAVSGATYRGHEGMRQWYRDVIEAWEEIRSTPEAFFDLREHVLVFTLIGGRGRQSGIEAEVPIAAVARVRDGLIVEYWAYTDRADALRYLGVTEGELEPV